MRRNLHIWINYSLPQASSQESLDCPIFWRYITPQMETESHGVEFLLPRVDGWENTYDSSSWNTVARLGERFDKELCRHGAGIPIAECTCNVQERFPWRAGSRVAAETDGNIASNSSASWALSTVQWVALSHSSINLDIPLAIWRSGVLNINNGCLPESVFRNGKTHNLYSIVSIIEMN